MIDQAEMRRRQVECRHEALHCTAGTPLHASYVSAEAMWVIAEQIQIYLTCLSDDITALSASPAPQEAGNARRRKSA